MRIKGWKAASVWTFAWLLTALCFGPATSEAKLRLKFGGQLESSFFVGVEPNPADPSVAGLGKYYNFRNSNSLNLTLQPKIGRLQDKAELQIRNLNFSRATTTADLQNYNSMFPVSVRLNEAYIDFLDLTDWFDMRVGQQRIAWGTGVAFNPTDNINPFNLENPLDFTARLPVPAIRMNFYIVPDTLTLTLVGVPVYTPAVLPISLFRAVAVSSIPLPFKEDDKTKIGNIKTVENLEQPAFDVSNTQAAAKLAGEFKVENDEGDTVWSINTSVSYYYGRLMIPTPNASKLTGLDLRVDKGLTYLDVDVTANLIYPRVHVVGFDFSTSIGSVDFFGEFALFIPVEGVNMNIDLGPVAGIAGAFIPGGKIDPVTTLDAEPYVKAVVGLEYTFPGGWFFNLQYVYGFFNEVTASALNHYAFLVMRKTFLRDKIILQVTLGGEMDFLTDAEQKKYGRAQSFAFLFNPELVFKPFDSGEIVLGGVIARGQETTTLKIFEDLTQVYARFRMKF